MADNRELPVIQRNVSPVYKGFFNYQIKDSGTPDNYNWEPAYEDIRLNNRFELLSNHGLDVFGGDIDSLVELVASDIDDQEMLDTYLTTRNANAVGEGKAMLEGMPDPLQEMEFAKLPLQAQQRLRDVGYKLPSDKSPGFAWGLGGIPYVGGFVRGATKVATKTLGIGAKIVQLDKAWELLMMSSRFAQRTGRSLAYVDAKQGQFLGDIGSVMDGWRMTEHAETSFDERSSEQLMAMGFSEMEMETLKHYAGFAENGLWDLIIKRTGLEDEEAIRTEFLKEKEWLNSERARDALSVLDEGRVDTFEYARKFYNKNNMFLPDAERGTFYGNVISFTGSMATEILLDPTTWAGGIWTKAIKLTRPAQMATVRPGIFKRTGMKMKARIKGESLKKGPWQPRESTWNHIDFWNTLTDAVRANDLKSAGVINYKSVGTKNALKLEGWFDAARAENFFGGIKPILLWRARQLIRFQDDVADAFKNMDELDDLARQIFREGSEAQKQVTWRQAKETAKQQLNGKYPDWVDPETYLLKKYKGLFPVYQKMLTWHKQKRAVQYAAPKGDVWEAFVESGMFPRETLEGMYTSAFTQSKKGLSTPDGLWEFMHSEVGTTALSTGFGGRGAANAVLLPTGFGARISGFAREAIDKTVDYGARDFKSTAGAKLMSHEAMKYLTQQGKWVARELSERMNKPIGDPDMIVIRGVNGEILKPLDARSIGLILETAAHQIGQFRTSKDIVLDQDLLRQLGISQNSGASQIKELVKTADNLKKSYVEYAKKNNLFDDLFNYYADQGLNLDDAGTLKNLKTGERPTVFQGWGRVYRNYLEQARHVPGSTNDELINVLETGALGTGTHIKAFAVQMMYHPAKLAKKLTTHVPLNNVINVLDDKTAIKEFDSLVEMGILADMPREVIDHFKHTFINGNEAQRWNVQVEFLMDFLGRSGAILHGGPRIDSFVRQFVTKADHVYDIVRNDGVDFFGGFKVKRAVLPGVAVSAQLSNLNILPDYRQLAGITRYMGWMRNMGWGLHLATIDKLFSKVWRPSVLLRFGYIPRNGGDELLQFALREGLQPVVRGRLARLINGRTVMFDKYGTKVTAKKGASIADEYEELLAGQDMKQLIGLNLKSVGEVHHNKLMGLLFAPLRFAAEITGVGDIAVTRKALKEISETSRGDFQFGTWEQQRKIFESARDAERAKASGLVRGKIFYRGHVLGQWAAARSSELMHIWGNNAGLMTKADYARKIAGRLDDGAEIENHLDAMDVLLSHPSMRDAFMRDLFNTYDPYLNPQHSLDEAMRAGGFGRAIAARQRIPLDYAKSSMKWVSGSADSDTIDFWNGINSQLVEMSQSPAHVLMAKEISQYMSPKWEQSNRRILDALGIGYDANDSVGASRIIAEIGERLTVNQQRALKQFYGFTADLSHTDAIDIGATRFSTEYHNWATNTDVDNNMVDTFFTFLDQGYVEPDDILVRKPSGNYVIEQKTDAFGNPVFKKWKNPDGDYWANIFDEDWMSKVLGNDEARKAIPRLLAMALIGPDSKRLTTDVSQVLSLALDANKTYMRSPTGSQLAQSMIGYESGGTALAGQTGRAPSLEGAVRVWTPKLSEPAMRGLADYLILAGQNPDLAIHIQNKIYRKLMDSLPATLPDREKIADRVLTLIHPAVDPYTERTIGSFEDMIGFSKALDQTHIPLLAGSADPHVASAIGKAIDDAMREVAQMPSGAGITPDWLSPKLEVRDISSDAFFHKPGVVAARHNAQYGQAPRTIQNGTRQEVVSNVAGLEPQGSNIFYSADDTGRIITPEDVRGFEDQPVFGVRQDILAQPGGVVQVSDGIPQVVLNRRWKRKHPETGKTEHYFTQDGFTSADFNPDDWEMVDTFHTVLDNYDADIARMADTQLDGLKALTISQSDDAMFEMIFELLDEEVIPARYMSVGDVKDLPKSIYAEVGVEARKLKGGEKFDHLWNKVLTAWFDGVIHPAMEAMVREPMFTHYFAEAWRMYERSENVSLVGLSDDLPMLKELNFFDNRKIVRGTGLAEETFDHYWIPELEHFVRHVVPNQALDPQNPLSRFAEALTLQDTAKADTILSRGGDPFLEALNKRIADGIKNSATPMHRKQVVAELSRYTNRRFNAHQARVNHSLEKAGATTASFIDDHRIRSQFQEMVGSLIPFWFAEDLYLRRWARGLTQNPLMLRNLQLTIRGGEKAGFVKEDDNGRRYLVMPGTIPSNNLLAEAISSVPVVGQYLAGVTDISVMDQMFRLDRLMPGYDLETIGRPQVGPFISYPLSRLAVSDPTIYEDLSPFMQERFAYIADNRDDEDAGNSKLHDFLDAFFPYPVSQALIKFSPIGHWNRGEQFASAQIQAVKLRQATGRMPTEDQVARLEDPDLFSEEFMEQLDHEANAIMGMRFVTWMFGTGQGTPESLRFGEAWDWNSEFHFYIKQGWTYDEALLMFYDNHKYDEDFDKDSWETQTKMSLFKTSTTKKVGVGYMQQSQAVDEWLIKNGEWATQHPYATSFLVPYETGLEYNEDLAWGWKQRQIAKGLRELKSQEEYVKDFYFSGAATEFYDRSNKAAYAIAVLESQNQTEAAKELRARNTKWEEMFYQRHPVFTRELFNGQSRARRNATLEEFKNIIKQPDLIPDTPNKDEILDVMKDIVRLDYELSIISGTDNAGDYRSFVKAFFLKRIEAKVEGKPYLQPLLNNLVIPLLNQEWVAKLKAGLITITPKRIPDREWTGVAL